MEVGFYNGKGKLTFPKGKLTDKPEVYERQFEMGKYIELQELEFETRGFVDDTKNIIHRFFIVVEPHCYFARTSFRLCVS